MNYWELLGTILGIVGVYFSYKNSYWGFVIGLGSTIIYIFICWHGKLYGESFLNLYYTIMGIVGWVTWARKRDDNKAKVPISFCDTKNWISSIVLLFVLWAGIYIILKKYSDSNVPFLDSFTVAASYIAMGLLVARKVENWLWWIIVNIVSIGLFFYKGYTITCLQFIVLLIIAIKAYMDWNMEVKKTNIESIKNEPSI